MMQSTLVKYGWENYYMLYYFIHTKKRKCWPLQRRHAENGFTYQMSLCKNVEYCPCRCISFDTYFISEAHKRGEFNFCKYIPRAKTWIQFSFWKNLHTFTNLKILIQTHLKNIHTILFVARAYFRHWFLHFNYLFLSQ